MQLVKILEFAFSLEIYNATSAHQTLFPLPKGGSVYVESPEEILADKIVACFDRINIRGTLKPSDLFDIYYISEQFAIHNLEKELIDKKLRDYSLAPTILNTTKLFNYLNDKQNLVKIDTFFKDFLSKKYVDKLDVQTVVCCAREMFKYVECLYTINGNK